MMKKDTFLQKNFIFLLIFIYNLPFRIPLQSIQKN